MNEVDIYTRSVNLHKITDATYIDKYVDMYKYLIDLFNQFEIFETEKYPGIQFFGKSEEDIYGQLNNDYNSCAFDIKKFGYFNQNIYFEILKKYISEYYNNDYNYIIPNDKISRFYDPYSSIKHKVLKDMEILYEFGDWRFNVTIFS